MSMIVLTSLLSILMTGKSLLYKKLVVEVEVEEQHLLKQNKH